MGRRRRVARYKYRISSTKLVENDMGIFNFKKWGMKKSKVAPYFSKWQENWSKIMFVFLI